MVFIFPIHDCRVRFLVCSLHCHHGQVITSIHDCVLCVCSQTPCSMYICDWPPRNLRPPALTPFAPQGTSLPWQKHHQTAGMQPNARGHFKQRSHPAGHCTKTTLAFRDKSLEHPISEKCRKGRPGDGKGTPVYSTKAVCLLIGPQLEMSMQGEADCCHSLQAPVGNDSMCRMC